MLIISDKENKSSISAKGLPGALTYSNDHNETKAEPRIRLRLGGLHQSGCIN